MFDRESLAKLGKWAGFVGVITLIMGILQVLTILGIISGVITIILGVKLLGAKSSAKAIAAYSGEIPAEQLNKMVNDLRVYFQINGVLMIIGIIFGVIGLIVSIGYGILTFQNLDLQEWIEVSMLMG